MIAPVGALAFFGTVAGPLATIAELHLISGRRLENPTPVARLDLRSVDFEDGIPAGLIGEQFLAHTLGYGRPLRSVRLFYGTSPGLGGEVATKVVTREDGFGILEKRRQNSLRHAIIFKLDFSLDVVGQKRHAAGGPSQVAILDQTVRVEGEDESVAAVGENAFVRDDFTVGAASNHRVFEIADIRSSK